MGEKGNLHSKEVRHTQRCRTETGEEPELPTMGAAVFGAYGARRVSTVAVHVWSTLCAVW